MLDKLLFHDGDLSPLTANDAQMAAFTDAQYSDALDNWTVAAQTAPYVGLDY